MKKILSIAAILAVVITFSACKTQKNISKQPPASRTFTAMTTDTVYVDELPVVGAKKVQKNNNWYPIPPRYQTLPGEGITERDQYGSMYIFNIEFPILPEREQQVYAPPLVENGEWLGADISQVLLTPFFMVVLALLFGFLLGYFSRRDRVSSIPTTSVATSFGQVPYDGTAVVRIIDVLRQTGGKFSCTHGESTIAVDIPEQKKEEPEKKD
jgi:hypothetical protein